MSKEKFLQENQRPGELYAGLLLGQDGAPDQHIFLLPSEALGLPWFKAKQWASLVGGELPSRHEQFLLFANLRGEFRQKWYWSSEQHEYADACAWYMDYRKGYQHGYPKVLFGSARAIRRLAIRPLGNFDQS